MQKQEGSNLEFGGTFVEQVVGGKVGWTGCLGRWGWMWRRLSERIGKWETWGGGREGSGREKRQRKWKGRWSRERRKLRTKRRETPCVFVCDLRLLAPLVLADLEISLNTSTRRISPLPCTSTLWGASGLSFNNGHSIGAIRGPLSWDSSVAMCKYCQHVFPPRKWSSQSFHEFIYLVLQPHSLEPSHVLY